MATHDYVIANGTGAAVRSDLNNALAAIVSNNSDTTEPTTTYAFQWWADTTNGQLKLRNAANSAWVVVGTLADTNLGLATLASPSFTGTVTSAGNISMTGTGAIDVAAGTTAQRPGSPSNGMFRYNSLMEHSKDMPLVLGEPSAGQAALRVADQTRSSTKTVKR